MLALRCVFVMSSCLCALAGDTVALIQAAKPEFELSATGSDKVRHASTPESGPTSELNYYYAQLGNDPLILFKLGETHRRLENLLVPGYVKRLPKGRIPEKWEVDRQGYLIDDKLPEGANLRSVKSGVKGLVQQTLGIVKNFPSKEIMETLKPVLRKKDYEEYEESTKEFRKLQDIVQDEDFQGVLERSAHGLKDLIYGQDLDKLLNNFKNNLDRLPQEKDPAKRGMLMRAAGDSMSSTISRITANVGKMAKDMYGGMEKTVNRHFPNGR